MAEEVSEHNKPSEKIIIFQDSPKSLIHINIKIKLSVPHSNKNYLLLIPEAYPEMQAP